MQPTSASEPTTARQEADERSGGTPSEALRIALALLAVAAFVALVLVIAPSAGAAGGCGGG